MSLANVRRLLRGRGIAFRLGPFNVSVRSSLPALARHVAELYVDYPVPSHDDLVDFEIALGAPSLLRRWVKPQVTFSWDGLIPFKPLPQHHSPALLEWGLNWCIANSAHQYLLVHAAVVARDDRAVILPGAPGSGKSTLCAGLLSRGWRLLSDEMALISLKNLWLTPVPRPVSLKNRSVEIVRGLGPDMELGPPVHGTAKGTLVHLRAPTASIHAQEQRARTVAVVFPSYADGGTHSCEPLSKGRTFLTLAQNSFNYHVLGTEAFPVLSDLVEQASCYRLEYGGMDEAVSSLEAIVSDG